MKKQFIKTKNLILTSAVGIIALSTYAYYASFQSIVGSVNQGVTDLTASEGPKKEEYVENIALSQEHSLTEKPLENGLTPNDSRQLRTGSITRTNDGSTDKGNEIIIAAENNNGVALTRSDIEALHKRQMEEIQQNTTDDTVIIESEETGERMTLGEIRALHREQEAELQRQLNDPNHVILTEDTSGGEDFRPITLGEIEELHRRQKEEIQQAEMNPEAVAVDLGEGAFISNKELLEMHEKQSIQAFKDSVDPDLVVIDGSASGDGKDVTLKDVMELHQEQER